MIIDYKNIKIIWFCFGFEVYNDSNYFKNDLLLDKMTKQKFPETQKSKKDIFIEAARPYYRLVKPNLPLSQREYKHKAMQRIDFLGSSFQEEFKQVCKLIKQKKKFFHFWYYPLELIVDVQQPIQHTKSKIIIGNSGFKSKRVTEVVKLWLAAQSPMYPKSSK